MKNDQRNSQPNQVTNLQIYQSASQPTNQINKEQTNEKQLASWLSEETNQLWKCSAVWEVV